MKTFLNKIVMFMIIVSFGTVSCNKFLEEHPNGRVASDKVFTKKEDLYSAQYALQQRVAFLSKHALTFIPWLSGDDLASHSASNKWAFREFDVMTVGDQNAYMVNTNTGNWTNLWKVIKAANYNIDYVDKALSLGATQEEVDRAKGVAYFWRAYAYFYLVRIWGPLPLILRSDVIDMNSPVFKVSEVFDQIVDDLKTAEELLPFNHTGVPWVLNGTNTVPNKAAAQATLSCVYLHMASPFPLNYGSEYYALAAEYAKKVIDGCENGAYYYKLYEYKGENTGYCQIHSRAENWHNTEALLFVPFYPEGTSDDGASARGCINDIHECSGGYNDIVAEIGYWIDFPGGDRKEWTYAPATFVNSYRDPDRADDDPWKNFGKAFPWWHDNVPILERQPTSRKTAFTSWEGTTIYSNQEYDHYMSFNQNPGGPQSNGWSDQARLVIRLSEVYLWYAEAMFRQGTVDAKAVELLNKVRNRANGAGDPARDIYNAGMGAKSLADAAFNEHGWEVACYYPALSPRYSDMQRMTDDNGVSLVKKHYEWRKSMQDNNLKYDIRENGVTVASLRELYGPVEPWRDEKMYATYPAPDKRQVKTLEEADKNKLNLIK